MASAATARIRRAGAASQPSLSRSRPRHSPSSPVREPDRTRARSDRRRRARRARHRGIRDGTRHTVTTDPAGVYSLPVLEPGRYTLIVSLPAFREARTTIDLAARQQAVRNVSLEILPIEGSVTVEADAVDAIRAAVADHYNRNKTVTSMEGKTVVDYSPVANYDALRLLPGVMSAGQKDRFSVPSHLRGAGAWGQVEQVDDYPSINITPVSAEDGGYTASFSSIIPSLALNNLTLATGGLGVSYGQASGGIVRSGIKRGSARGPRSTVRVEGMGVGEGVLQADTGGVFGNLDVYAAGQTVQGDYGDKFATYARPMEGLSLFSGLVKAGYRVGANGRAEALVIAGDETHDYYQLAFSQALQRNQRRDYHTDKSNVFAAARYDVRPASNLVFGVGVTHNRFHENRIEDTFDGAPIGLSRRNRPQQATRVFANGDYRTTLRQGLDYNAIGGRRSHVGQVSRHHDDAALVLVPRAVGVLSQLAGDRLGADGERGHPRQRGERRIPDAHAGAVRRRRGLCAADEDAAEGLVFDRLQGEQGVLPVVGQRPVHPASGIGRPASVEDRHAGSGRGADAAQHVALIRDGARLLLSHRRSRPLQLRQHRQRRAVL